MCKILSVNEKGYYKKLKVGKRILKWQKLLCEIHKVLNEDVNNDNYGAKRILLALQQKGIKTYFLCCMVRKYHSKQSFTE